MNRDAFVIDSGTFLAYQGLPENKTDKHPDLSSMLTDRFSDIHLCIKVELFEVLVCVENPDVSPPNFLSVLWDPSAQNHFLHYP